MIKNTLTFVLYLVTISYKKKQLFVIIYQFQWIQYKTIQKMYMKDLIDEQIKGKNSTIEIQPSNSQTNDYALEVLCSYSDSDRSNIQILSLECDSITAKGILPFQKTCWINLTRINISWCKIGSKGCKYLSRASMPKLQKLQIANNSIESQGVGHLMKAQWKQMKDLLVFDNNLGIGSVQSIGKASWRSVKGITLSWNKINYEEFKYILLDQLLLERLCHNCNKMEQMQADRLNQLLLQKSKEIAINI